MVALFVTQVSSLRLCDAVSDSSRRGPSARAKRGGFNVPSLGCTLRVCRVTSCTGFPLSSGQPRTGQGAPRCSRERQPWTLASRSQALSRPAAASKGRRSPCTSRRTCGSSGAHNEERALVGLSWSCVRQFAPVCPRLAASSPSCCRGAVVDLPSCCAAAPFCHLQRCPGVEEGPGSGPGGRESRRGALPVIPREVRMRPLQPSLRLKVNH